MFDVSFPHVRCCTTQSKDVSAILCALTLKRVQKLQINFNLFKPQFQLILEQCHKMRHEMVHFSILAYEKSWRLSGNMWPDLAKTTNMDAWLLLSGCDPVNEVTADDIICCESTKHKTGVKQNIPMLLCQKFCMHYVGWCVIWIFFCLLMLLSNEVFGYFSIYVGGLLVKLSNANVGCHVELVD